MAYETWDRYSLASLAENKQDSRGRLFLSNLGQQNLGAVTLLHEGVDTIRQLYHGLLKPDVLDELKASWELGPGSGGRGRLVNLLGREWLLGSGGKSGYRYRLQDNNLGLILFIHSRYAVETVPDSHLKIELSPHFIDERKTGSIQGYMNNLAACLLVDPRPTGCAVHICVDVQGWQPPKGFADLLVTRSKRRVDHRGISEAEFSMSELATVYGASQSYLFGLASGLQFSLYRKDLQVKAIDKLHFWQSVWERRTDEYFKPLYDPEKPVWRFEFRFHHSVINEFGDFIHEPLHTFTDVVDHLTGLLRYGLENFRLHPVSASGRPSKTYIDPMWQLLLQDVQVHGPDPGLDYRRSRKGPGMGNMRNVRNVVGNMLSLYACYGISPLDAVKLLMQSGIWEDIKVMIRSKFKQVMTDDQVKARFTDQVTEGLRIRTLCGACT